MEFLIIGLAAAFNIIVIKAKFERGRVADGIMDAAFLILVTVVFSGSYGALVVGTIASAIFSIYLMISPPKFTSNSSPEIDKLKKRFTDEFKQRMDDRFG